MSGIRTALLTGVVAAAAISVVTLGAGTAYADITGPATGETVGTTTPVVSGEGGPAGGTVTVTARQGPAEVLGCASVAIDPDGTWRCTFANPIAVGVWDIEAVEVDAGGTERVSTVTDITVAVVEESAPPVAEAPVTEPPTTQSPTAGPSSSDPAASAPVSPTRTALPVTPAGDPLPYFAIGVALLFGGGLLMIWLTRLRRDRG